MNDAQRPQLGASDARLLFNLLKVSLDGIEYQSEPPQYTRRGFANFTAGGAARCCERGGDCGLAFDHREMIWHRH